MAAVLKRLPRAARWLLAVLLVSFVSFGALFEAYLALGQTPGRIMDYAERRLDGHAKLEAIALPLINVVRGLLDEPSLLERHSRPFDIPSPPPLRSDETSAGGGTSEGRVWRVGPREAIRSISEVSHVALDGDTVEIVSGEYRGDVAVWLQKRLIIRGIGGNARLFADGRSAEDKAIWVIRNGDFDVSNVEFIGARVADLNGAGIRFEGGHLTVRNCLFWGNDTGLLTSGGPDRGSARLEIEGSEFAYNGYGDGQSHHLYVGSIGSLRVTGSYFHHGNVGHLIKSRAAVNEIRYNRITDEQGGRASYEVDLPNGGIAIMVGNVIQQSRGTENPTLISFGEEGYQWPVNRLYLMSNTLVNDQPYGGAFLRAAQGADSIISANNVLSGRGAHHTSDLTQSMNDVTGDRSLFADAQPYDYRLSKSGRKMLFQKPVTASFRNFPLDLRAEYVHPRQVRALPGPPAFVGAVQTLPP